MSDENKDKKDYSSDNELREQYENFLKKELDKEEKEFDREELAEKRDIKYSVITWLLLAAALVAALVIFAANANNKEKVNRNKYSNSSSTAVTEDASVKVPDIIGMKQEDAEQILQAQGLGLRVVSQVPDNKEYGTILDQNPKKNGEIEKNGTLEVTVSQGAQSVKIPNQLVGNSEDDVYNKLKSLGFGDIRIVKKLSSKVDIGNVISVSPEEGTSVYTTNSVVLEVSSGSGKRMSTAQNYINYKLDDALYMAQSDGLVPRVSYGSSDIVAPDAVMYQSIAPNESVTQGTDINLIVNKQNIKSKGNRNGWRAKIQLKKGPDSYNGGEFRLVLDQYEDGVLFEHQLKHGISLSFPIRTEITGISNVKEGTVYLYEKINDAYVRRCSWEVSFSKH